MLTTTPENMKSQLYQAFGRLKDGATSCNEYHTERAANLTKARALFAKYYHLAGPVTLASR
jgi:hypothetical protein